MVLFASHARAVIGSTFGNFVVALLASLTFSEDISEQFLAQSSPSWPLPLGVDALADVVYPPQWPWTSGDLQREDESDDKHFYNQPRLVKHIDENAIQGLTLWYDTHLPSGDVSILDVCSSWISHFPKSFSAARVVGVGMNVEELQKNQQLTEHVAQDLNKMPRFSFGDGTFDAIVNAVSVDYLSKPREMFEEFRRMVRPGGLVAMSFSNRMFWSKAIKRWTKADEFQRLLICGSYFHYAGFEGVRAERIDAGRGDPMYVVYARASGSKTAHEERGEDL